MGIYTRKGDKGQTSLGSKEKVSKSHHRIVALGSIDELNAILGLAISYVPWLTKDKLIKEIQEDLLLLGAIVSEIPDIEIENDRIAFLEEYIDTVSAKLVPLNNFILPGGDPGAAWLHLARTVCRRAEIDIVTVNEIDGNIPENILIYMNRLSDLLFVVARRCNDNGAKDVLWVKHCPLKGE
jgi:cob(I)alamin adenosyltransferase